MKLGINERLILFSMLPKQEEFLLFKIVRQLRNDLSFSEEEIKKFELKSNIDGEGKDAVIRTFWNKQKEEEKDIEFGEKAKELIINILKDLSKNKKIDDSNYSLYEKFVKE